VLKVKHCNENKSHLINSQKKYFVTAYLLVIYVFAYELFSGLNC